MYHNFFGLTQAPFKMTPDTRLFFAGGSRGEVLDALVYAIMTGEGIIKVVGEVGSGKTMLCRMLAVKLPASVEIIFIANPSLSPEDIFHAIAFEMKLPIKGDAKRLEVVDTLQRRLLEKHEQNERVVVFVDEAQSMSIATLEEIRLLSNLETEHEKLLQIVLFGQPELNCNLNSSNIRQLRERITHSFCVWPFDRNDVSDYINFRLRATGYRGPDFFSKAACRRLWRASAGLVRRVNILADKSMLAAYAGNTHRVTHHHVATAIRDSELRFVSRISTSAYAAIGLSIVILCTVVGWAIAYPDRIAWQKPDAHLTILPTAPAETVSNQIGGGGDGPVAQLAMTDRVGVTRAVVPAPAEIVRGESGSSVDATQNPLVPPGALGSNALVVAETGPAAVATSSAQSREVDRSAVTVAHGVVVEPAPRGEASDTGSESERQIEASIVNLPSYPGTALPMHSRDPVDTTHDLASASREHALGSGEDSLSPQKAPRSPVEAVEPVVGTAVEERHRLVAVDSEEPTPPAHISSEATASTKNQQEPDIVSRRLNATKQWFGQVDSGHYSIQLLVTEERRRDNLAVFLAESQTAVELEKLYVYKRKMRGNVWFSVLYNEYETLNDARRALDGLPDTLKLSAPFVRRIRHVWALVMNEDLAENVW